MTLVDRATAPGHPAWWNQQALYWLIRIGGFAAIVPLTLTLTRTGSSHRPFVVSVLAAGGVLLAGVIHRTGRGKP